MFWDAAMVVLWTTTYIFALFFSVRNKTYIIPPLTHAVIAPAEFGPLISFLWRGSIAFNYVFFAYVVWCALEVLLFVNLVRIKAVNKRKLTVLISVFVLLTGLVTYLIVFKGQMLFLNYFNTFIGETIWLYCIFKDDYFKNKNVVLVFISKFLADLFAVFFYYGMGTVTIKILAVALPVVDVIMIVTYVLLNRSLWFPERQDRKRSETRK